MLIHVVAYLPPTISGVGDYALELARTLREQCSLDSSFIVCDPRHRAVKLDDFQVESIPQRTPAALSKTCNVLARAHGNGAQAILIHYVGYGYHPRGAPLWFARGVRELKRGHGEASPPTRVLTMFHELFATGRPWQSSFWLSWAQRAIATDIARMSDGILTNRAASAEWLARARARERPCPISWLPVFSNVGEPSRLKPIIERPHAAVIWGSAQARRTIYRMRARELHEFCRTQGITELHDIGAPISERPKLSGDIQTFTHSLLPPDRIQEVLTEARFGIFEYWPESLTKSSVYAAYRAFGVVPVLANAGQHGVATSADIAPVLSISSVMLKRIEDQELVKHSEAARNSYRHHGKSQHAKAILELI